MNKTNMRRARQRIRGEGWKPQSGASKGLYVVVGLLCVAVAFLLIGTFNRSNNELERDKKEAAESREELRETVENYSYSKQQRAAQDESIKMRRAGYKLRSDGMWVKEIEF